MSPASVVESDGRHLDGEHRARDPGTLFDAGTAAVGGRQGGHDRQPEPGPLSGARLAASVEAVEESRGLLGVEPRALVGHA